MVTAIPPFHSNKEANNLEWWEWEWEWEWEWDDEESKMTGVKHKRRGTHIQIQVQIQMKMKIRLHSLYMVFCSTLLELLSPVSPLRPTHLVAALDRGKTFRNAIFPNYKAHRITVPDDLKWQLRETGSTL